MFKRLFLITSSGLLKITLLSFALAGAGWMVFGTPNKIKQAADDSGLYSSAVDSVLETTKKQALKDNAQLPLDQPELIAAAKNAFPPELLSKNSESIINGFYNWLKSDTKTPQFSVDLTEAKQSFANGIGDYAVKRYEALPPCSSAQLRTMNTDVDAFSVDCRPPGLLSSTVREQVQSQILNSGEFLGDTTFTADDLPKAENGKTFAENMSVAPTAFNAFRLMPWVLGLLGLLFASGVLFLSKDKRQGLKTIAVTLVGTGIFLMLGSLLINFLFNKMNQPKDAFGASVASVAKTLTADYNTALMRFYIVYIALGVAVLIALKLKSHGTTAVATKPKK